MITKTRHSLAAALAVFVAFLACFSLLSCAVAGAVTVTYTPESLAEYEHQLAAGQVHAVTINKDLRRLHVTLADGSHVSARYPPKQEPTYAAALQAKHVAVTVLTPTEAVAEAKAVPVHHKIRYIVGGVVIVVIVVVAGVLIYRRRRQYE